MHWERIAAGVLAIGGLTEMLVGQVGSPVVLTAGVVGTAALALRPRWPLAAPIACLAAFAVPVVVSGVQVPMLGDGPNSVGLMVAWLLAVFFAGMQRQFRRAVAGLGVTVAICALYAVGPGAPADSSGNDVLAAFLFSGAVPWLAGFALARQRRVRAAEQVIEEAQIAAAVERSRIAREVHDLVAHTVSVMVVQAEAAEALLPTAPERSVESLRAVQAAGRQALSEMRRTVAALRSGDVDAAGRGLAALPELLDTVRTAGLPVTVIAEGTPGELPDEVDRSAYRILQESLTNVLRHSDRTGATVRLTYEPARITVSVVDEGRPVRRMFSGGHGLAGITERVMTLGGTLDAGPTADGGHLVHAVVPIAMPS